MIQEPYIWKYSEFSQDNPKSNILESSRTKQKV